MRELVATLAAAITMAVASESLSWNPPTDTAGPLTIEIKDVGVVKEVEKPIPVEVTITNSAQESISGTVALSVIDDWRIEKPNPQPFTVNSRDSVALSSRVVAGKRTYSALYPIHARAIFEHNREKFEAHAVLIVKTEVPAEPLPVERTTHISSSGPVSLWRLRNQTIGWERFGGQKREQPIGWEGADRESKCTFTKIRSVRLGEKEFPALAMHPPWVGGAGTIYADYSLSLPTMKPIRLVFHTAIRESSPKEPPSDGVTFRVWVGEEKLFERHSDSKVWVEGEADLSKFAGEEIVLRLESHPGPKADTTCDLSYWGSPTLIVAKLPQMETHEEIKVRMRSEAEGVLKAAVEAASGGKKQIPGLRFFELRAGSDPCVAAVKPGKYGLLDAVFAFACKERTLAMYGLEIAVLDGSLLDPASGFVVSDVRQSVRDGVLKVAHRIEGQGESFDVSAEVNAQKEALKITISSPERITDFSPGSFSEKAARVYAGMGNAIVRPSAFRLNGDGHFLSTSHVGVDFENRISLLEAVSVPPDFFQVDPQRGVYAIHTHLDGTLLLLPSAEGAFEAAMKYREIVGQEASAGAQKLAGRFVFDVWGGRGYRDTAEDLRRAIRYGMTDAVLIYHNWQRWGYDYRLPDIFPPNPARGTLAEFRELAEICRNAGILFAPHDNYIDFYPDAEGYTYEGIAFSADNRPVQAWFNAGRAAQSYRFRPDKIRPFVSRNIRLMKENVQPTAYFIDVFSSLTPFDYHDRGGRFHPKTETQRVWGETFDFVRHRLGENAPQISESGHDALIGWLDGATCNHLRVDPTSKEWTVWPIECDDAERTPWYDAVHRHRFILHGAGYSGRYQGGLDARNHGIDSDDYVSTEVLDGHPGMVSAAFSRAAVRKYWLLHDIMRAIALRRVTKVEFADGDIHRQVISYEDEAKVFVNRGKTDWAVSTHVLPQHGFVAQAGEVEAGVERKNGIIVDWSSSPSSLYVNARKVDHQGRPASEHPDDPRFNPDGKVVDFGVVRTNGALRLTWDDEGITVTPLPREDAFDFEIAAEGGTLGRKLPATKRVAALDETGSIVGQLDFSSSRGSLHIKADGKAFAYRAEW